MGSRCFLPEEEAAEAAIFGFAWESRSDKTGAAGFDELEAAAELAAGPACTGRDGMGLGLSAIFAGAGATGSAYASKDGTLFSPALGAAFSWLLILFQVGWCFEDEETVLYLGRL